MIDPETLWEITKTVRQEILLRYPRDTCVLSARALIEVLDVMGIAARPHPVKVQAFGPPASHVLWDRLTQDILPPRGNKLGRFLKEQKSHSVAIGYGKTLLAKWGGHLTVLADGDRYLLDPSLDMAARPEKGMSLAPLVLEMTNPHFLCEEGAVEVVFHGNCLCMYFADPDNQVYQERGDWLEPLAWREIANAAVARLDLGSAAHYTR